ncbi:MAG: hypothetical protein LC808_29835 [Actinobacteria bacterium]|nr:hypothetical protein [Actinomycetota bacterium]
MKRVLLATFLALAAVLALGPSAVGDPGHERPKITVMRWQDPPVTTSTGECDALGNCGEEILILKAHDPDSSITEIQVWFDENGNRAPFVFAHTYCVQGRKAGQEARLEIGASFSEPGDYTVAAVAYSHKRCLGHEKGDGHPSLHSRVKRLQTTVEAATP